LPHGVNLPATNFRLYPALIFPNCSLELVALKAGCLAGSIESGLSVVCFLVNQKLEKKRRQALKECAVGKLRAAGRLMEW
jgi:hypothetical protein